MNTFLGIAIYAGERFTDNGLRFMEMQLPKVGNSGGDVPIMVVPNRAAGESFDVFQPGARLLISGRMYPSRQDYKMYIVPNQAFILVNDKNLQINRVNISGSVGYIPDQVKEDLFTFTVMCSAPAQMVLGHNWEDSLSFRMESWGEDARRLDKMLHVGRQVSVEGILRYNTWVAQDGSHRGSYQIRVRAGLYAAFGKNKKLVDLEGAKAEESVKKVEASVTLPKVQLQQEPLNTAPCSVNTDEIPF
jgi:single-stranded DNA-binding protein